MSDFAMTIGGQSMPAVDTFEVINPATGAASRTAPECTKRSSTRRCSPRPTPTRPGARTRRARRQTLNECAAAIQARPATSRRCSRRSRASRCRRRWRRSSARRCGSATRRRSRSRRGPAGRRARSASRCAASRSAWSAAITPWNFPVILPSWKLAPALLAGNTVVLKPSPFTPLTTLKLGEILRDVLPAGVLNVISGGNDLGGWITEPPGGAQDLVHRHRRHRQEGRGRRGADLKRVTLELGGNDAAIVLDDVDPKAIVAEALLGRVPELAARCAPRSSASTCPRRSTTRSSTSSPRSRAA